MSSKRSVLSMIGLAAALAATLGAGGMVANASAVPGPEKAQAKIGQPAPDFTLKDAAGKSYKLSDYKGKIVVLQWINPECPVCKGCFDRGVVSAMTKELKAADLEIVQLAINSTHSATPEQSAKYLKEHESKMPGLDDASGKVGKMYGAKTTPHLFVIDQEGVLRYSGAINDDRRGKKGDDAINYAVNAVRQIKAGETVAPDSTKSYGCSVKYKS